MNTQKKLDRIQRLLDGLADEGIDNAVIALELETAEGLTPHLLRQGSPMACFALTGWAYNFQDEEVNEGLDVSIWYDDDEEDEYGY